MTTASAVIEAELLDAARGLRPLIASLRDETETGKRLPLPIVRALQEAGIIRMAMPRAWGGIEAHPLTQFDVLEELTRTDASAGWCAYIGSAGGHFCAFLEDRVGRELYPSVDLYTGGGARPTGKAVAVDGGYLVGGRWPFGSGVHHCSWLTNGCFVYDGDMPRTGPDGRPVSLLAMVPQAAVEILDTWTTTGLRGSGSNDYICSDVFVPEERTFNMATTPLYRPEPLYHFRRMLIFNHSAIAIGIARAAIDALVELATTKGAPAGGKLRDEAYVQAAVGRAEVVTGSARSYCFAVMNEIWDSLLAGAKVSASQLARFRLAITHAHDAARETVDLMYHVAGGSSIYATNPLDRQLRDIHTISQHAVASPKTIETAGRLLLGLDMGAAPL
ncbi:MAG: acyl-CoA dehydrogenase family protein [Dehalococcoidia bacterium]